MRPKPVFSTVFFRYATRILVLERWYQVTVQQRESRILEPVLVFEDDADLIVLHLSGNGLFRVDASCFRAEPVATAASNERPDNRPFPTKKVISQQRLAVSLPWTENGTGQSADQIGSPHQP